MRMVVMLGLFLCTAPLGAAYESALAPYPWRRTEPYAPEVEAILATIEANGPADGAFAVSIEWTCESDRRLEDPIRDRYGPFSAKASLNWHPPDGDGYWKQGVTSIRGFGTDFRIATAAMNTTDGDWWQKQGEHVFARKFCDDWSSVWRFHHDALEAGMLAYTEGVGLLLWAFQGAEYLRRAERLAVGEDAEIDGWACRTLIATPDWVTREYWLENRRQYPFNHSTMCSWATLRPIITYFVDRELGVIIAAEFAYLHCHRSHPKDWKPVAAPNGIRVVCVADQLDATEGGTLYPSRIRGEVFEGKTRSRTLVAHVNILPAPQAALELSLPAEKRTLDPWPQYRPEVYEAFVSRGEVDYAVGVGYARALAYEKRLNEAANAFLGTVMSLEADAQIAYETLAGIDWDVGWALYEYFRWSSDDDLFRLWARIPRTSLWRSISARGLAMYRQYFGEDAERIEALHDQFNAAFLGYLISERRTRRLEFLHAESLRRAQSDRDDGLVRRAEALEARAQRLATELSR